MIITIIITIDVVLHYFVIIFVSRPIVALFPGALGNLWWHLLN